MGLKTTRQTPLAVQQVLTWTGQGTSGVGLLHVLVYDRYVKVWKSTVLIQDVGREPQLLARLRAYARNARQQGAVLAQAPLIFLSKTPEYRELYPHALARLRTLALLRRAVSGLQ